MATEHNQEAWVQLPSEEEFAARFGEQTHPYQILMGGVAPRMGRLIMAHDMIGQALGALSATVLFGPGALSRPEREMVAAVTAAAQDCAY
jgi:hypothetical protein